MFPECSDDQSKISKMDTENTEYIIPSEISKRRRKYYSRYLVKKERCHWILEVKENIPINNEFWESQKVRIPFIDEDHRNHKMGRQQMNISQKAIIEDLEEKEQILKRWHDDLRTGYPRYKRIF